MDVGIPFNKLGDGPGEILFMTLLFYVAQYLIHFEFLK